MSSQPNSLADRDLRSVFHGQTHLSQLNEFGPMIMDHAEGIYIYDGAGKQYIEGVAGLWCTALGYGNEELAQVAYDQMKKLSYAHTFTGKGHEPSILLAEKLKEMLPIKNAKVFFGNSGSDANDTQIKLAWYYNNVTERPEKKKIISRVKGYHGITLAAGSLTGTPQSHVGFDLPLAGGRFLHTELPHFWRYGKQGESETEFATRMAESLESLIQREGADTIAAFIAEPIQGAGGVILPPKTYFEKVQRILKKHDILFIDDEVICAFGRTGNPFGADTYNLSPDSISLAKALTSAYQPLSAVVVKDEMYDAFLDASPEMGVFGHGYTYSGHPVACAVGLKTLEIYERDKLFEKAAGLAPQFQERLGRLADHPLVGESRGTGLIGAVELVSDKGSKAGFPVPGQMGAKIAKLSQEHGLIVRAIGDALAFCPPLIITSDQINEMFDKFEMAMAEGLEWASSEGMLNN
ncbi:MAG: aminotransferase class III-fold pyridoxal phosphate-dependent enzyme [Proteobacteria bacterium]|jgi:4-aminobutyrate---pyruvate transaminase|nr:aminotransferase class III-fold pyridoxal phosphate-dependent enzyme [Pseudomonadota bacterium]MBT6192686.1 aminotransferase class III-fold pyridoxal phosphate-dependent enzyme [Pseudomonadota bacterium]MBT6464245.1 aminotransferase class III-fold pyridoxal phosphate-dependent enzyme [Pseudomonadota bacterium]MBT6675376.1 aminotransferase class III-fold pyridoxal phosphate-dependent enzyme [Pseudomonadota bacterium]MBT7246903.1 aminotransferase class III-fold pyridoxal phosphate-dependent en